MNQYFYKLCFLLPFAFFAKSIVCQQVSITGNVKDSLSNPLSYATVSLYQHKAAKPFKTTYTNNKGIYVFTGIDTGSYHVSVSFSGYEDQKLEIEISRSSETLTLPEIVLAKQTKQLQNVTVTAYKKLIEIRDDGISYNAEADPMAGSDKLIDLLRKTPFITIDPNDNVEINGQSNFKILLNGRETSMFARNPKEALRSFPGSLIRRIDVITSPSSKYDAEGVGGIINIITKKKVLGYNGSLTLEGNSLSYRGANGSLNVKHGKIGFTGFAYAGGNINGIANRKEEMTIALTPAAFHSRTVTGVYKGLNTNPDMNIELVYDPDSLNTISIYGSAAWSHQKEYNDNTFLTLYSPSGNPEISNYFSFNRRKTPGWTGGIDFIHKFKENQERELSIRSFLSTGQENTEGFSDQVGSKERFVKNESHASDRQITLQADYVHPFKNKQKIETGIKTILRKADSDYESFVKFDPADDFILNSKNSDVFSYQQNVFGLYGNYLFTVKKINFRTGIRIEHTQVEGDFISSQTKVRQRYTHLIPNLLVSTRLKNGHNVSFTYSLRLSRPYMYSLNPFINNIDSFSVNTGNPDLRPQVFHNTTIQYRFNKGNTFFNMSLGNSYSSSYIIYSFLFDNATGVTTGKPLNGGTSNRIFLNFGINANPVAKWRLNLNGGVSYLSIKGKLTSIKHNEGFSGNIGYNSSYNFTPALSGTTFFNYYFPVVLLQGSRNGYFAYGFGTRYSFLKNKISVNGYINNPFNKDGIFKTISRFEDLNFSKLQISFSRFRAFGAGLTYNFGKLSENVSKKKGVQNNDLL